MLEKPFEFVLSLAERDFLLKETISIENNTLVKLRLARVVEGGIRVSLSMDEMDLFLDSLAYEANHAKNRTLENMFDAIFFRLSHLFDRTLTAEDGALPDMQAMTEILEVLAGERPLTNPELLSLETNPQMEYVTTSMDSLGGLSAAQGQELCARGWWDDNAPIRLNAALNDEDLKDAVFLRNARLLLNVIAEDGGAPLTAKGYLKRAFVAKLLDRLLMDGKQLELIRAVNTVIDEQDVMPLYVLRTVCEMGRLARKYNTKLVATKRALKLLTPEKMGELYAVLFDAFFNEFDLTNLDELPDDGDSVQGFVPYSLYRLSQLPPAESYPIVELTKMMIPPPLATRLDSFDEWITADHYLQNRILRPLVHFGLIDLCGERTIKRFYEETAVYRKTALFDKFLSFSVNI